MRLSEIQSLMQRDIFFPDGDRSELEGELLYPERMSVHRGALPAFATEYLAKMYVRLATLLRGDLDCVVRDYLQDIHPPHYDLGELVAEFGKYFVEHPRVRPYPALQDLAAFEAREYLVYHSAPPVLEELTRVAHDLARGLRVSLRLQGHAIVANYRYNMQQLFEHCEAGTVSHLEQLEIHAKPTTIVHFQQDHRAHFMAIDPEDRLFLENLLETDFVSSCEQTQEALDETRDFSPLLLGLFQRGVLMFALDDEPDGDIAKAKLGAQTA